MTQQPGPDHSVTVVVRRRVGEGRQQEFETWAAGVVAAAAQFPGHQGATILTPAMTGGEDNLLVFRFDTPAHLAAWDQSEVKRDWLGRIADATVEVRARQVTGLEFWFRLPSVPAGVTPPRAKMAAVTFLAIYPLALSAQLFLGPVLMPLPLPLRVVVIAGAMVTLMTYVVMPLLIRLFKPWLFKPPPRPSPPRVP